MTTLLALLAGMGITLLVVVYVLAGDEPRAAPAQSQDSAPAGAKSRYVKDPITGQWVDWDAELRSITSLGGSADVDPNAQPNLEDLLDEQAEARER